MLSSRTSLCSSSGVLTGVGFALVVATAAASGTAETTPLTSLIVDHLVERTTAIANRSRIIAFRTPTPSPEERAPVYEVADPAILEVIKKPRIEPGQTIGYVRVRALRAGDTTLSIGGAALQVHVEPEPAATHRFIPQVAGPSPGAAVWGKIHVGVETYEADRGPLREIDLYLSTGAVVRPMEDTGHTFFPHRYLVYEVDTGPLAPGPLGLRPVCRVGNLESQQGPETEVRVVRPTEADLVSGEAEQPYDVQRPERFKDDRVHIGHHPEASGGKFFNNAGAIPAVCFPVHVDQAGRYQMILQASGSRAQGALPTVEVVVDGAPQGVTTGRLLTDHWHRAAIGVPFPLEAGDHIITPFFFNDFYVAGVADRNLFIDRIELARVKTEEGTTDPGAAGAGMMSGPTMMSAMTAPSGGGASMADPLGLRSTPLRVSFAEPLDGQVLPGVFEVDARCYWPDFENHPAPRVTLKVNDRVVSTQRSGAPRFWVDPSFFSAGANRLQLVARLDSGATSESPVQTMHWPNEAARHKLAPRKHRRFTIHHELWDPPLREHFRNQHHPRERVAACFSANAQASLPLPEDLEGRYDIFVEVRGDAFDGPAIATLSVRQGDSPTPIAEFSAHNWWTNNKAGEVELVPGPKSFVIAFNNDKFEKDKGDRNLWFQSVTLVEKPHDKDTTPPFVAIRYPRGAHQAHGVDVLVAEASDNASLLNAELVVDGALSGMNVHLNLRPGRFVLPLLLDALPPGRHEFAVKATDIAGNSTQSEPRVIEVLETPPAGLSPYQRAVHLLNRFAYGPDPDELAALLVLGEDAWLADRLDRPFEDPGELAALASYFPYFVNRNDYEVPARAISHLLLTPNPVRARFVIWVQNHFSTWIRKVNGTRKWPEHVTFSRLGVARFADLLRASAESPAMLGYLDQDNSFVGKHNENYAREIMELHTLGVDGGYTQRDVTELAQLLTGWTASMEGDGINGGFQARSYTYRFDPQLSDGQVRRVLGMRFDEAVPGERLERVRAVLELLAAHPSTARFVARSLAEHYVSTPPPESLVRDLERAFLETHGDMRALLSTIAHHPAFWEDARSAKIASALDYAIRLGRTTAHTNPWQVAEYLRLCGQGLFDCPTPDGYSEADRAHTDSNATLQRWRLARDTMWQLAALVPGGWRYAASIGEQDWQQRIVDVIAVRLTGRVLTPPSRKAAIDLLAETQGSRDERVRVVGPFIAQLPEAALR